MSLSLYSIKAKEATKLKENGFEISVGENENGIQQIQFTREDGKQVSFNNIYTKDEINAYFDSGISPGEIENLHKTTIYPEGDVTIFNNPTDLTLTNSDATTLEELYDSLNMNATNLKGILSKMELDLSFNPNKIITEGEIINSIEYDRNTHYFKGTTTTIETYNQFLGKVN